MHLGKIVGMATASRKYEGLDGEKLLIVQPLDHTLKPAGATLIAVDTVKAGDGDLVYYVAGREATLAMERQFVPVDAAVVGIVDDVNDEWGGDRAR